MSGDPLYAHTTDDPTGAGWEPLSAHLNAVATTAERFAKAFAAAPAGRAMGLCHDLGKAAPAFQTYLKGTGPSPDHSAAGAVFAVDRYGPLLGRVLAFGIAGHHAGLANGRRIGGGVTPLTERLAAAAVPEGAARLAPCPSLSEVAAAGPLQGAPSGDPGFAFAFFTRMLFSCLVDADYRETERFYADRATTADSGSPDSDIAGDTIPGIGVLRDRLVRHLSDQFGAVPATAVNQVRARVLAAARQRASDAPGLFSLTVPTGGGKTLASLAFALDHAVSHGLRRVIYVIPFTSIVEQTADTLRRALGSDTAVLEHHSGFDPAAALSAAGRDDEARDGGRKLRQAAATWEPPIIVTTAVQFFESLFANRPSRCRKLHAIARAVVVLDEAQTLPLTFLRPCLEAVRELARGYGTSMVLCTATQPAVRREDGFKDGLDGVREIAPDPPQLYRSLTRVTVRRVEPTLDVDALAGRLAAADQVLCIVNNRRHARDLYQAISDRPGACHLTTGLCAAHRRSVLARLRQDLKDRRPVRLVATSLVEAGVDISFPLVYRAVAGLESIAQAAGRCNRHGELGDGACGEVLVFAPADNARHRPPPELRQLAAIGDTVLRAYAADPLGLDAIAAYFGEVYWTRGADALDGALIGRDGPRGVLRALAETSRTLDFPFADIAEAVRIIENPLVPAIVPYRPDHDPDAVARLVDRLAVVDRPGAIAARLQPYLVQIPPKARAALIGSGAAEAIRPADFGDQFIQITNRHLYRDDIGLDWDNPTYRDAELDIF